MSDSASSEPTVGQYINQFVDADNDVRKAERDLYRARAKREDIRSRISEMMEDLGTTSLTDGTTKNRATVYEETRWVVTSKVDLEDAVRESPYLRAEALIETIDEKQIIEMAKENPELFGDIPGIAQIAMRKTRITRAKGD